MILKNSFTIIILLTIAQKSYAIDYDISKNTKIPILATENQAQSENVQDNQNKIDKAILQKMKQFSSGIGPASPQQEFQPTSITYKQLKHAINTISDDLLIAFQTGQKKFRKLKKEIKSETIKSQQKNKMTKRTKPKKYIKKKLYVNNHEKLLMPSKLNRYSMIMKNQPIISPKILAEKNLIMKLLQLGSLTYNDVRMDLPDYAKVLKNQIQEMKKANAKHYRHARTLVPNLTIQKRRMPKLPLFKRLEAVRKQEVRDNVSSKKLVNFFL